VTIGKAKEFILRGMQDGDLRSQVLASKDTASLAMILEKKDLKFSDHHFDEAFHNLLTQCQTQEQADQLKEFRVWWLMTVSLTRQ